MSKHTAGPWSVTEDGEICAGPVEGSGICIGTLYAAEDYPCLDPEDEAKCDEEYKANAKLIAAAPDLLAALQSLYALVKGECPSLLENDHHDEMVSAAVAKATA